MKAETIAILAKSEELLKRAGNLFSQDFAEKSGRAACMAGFHAAQACIFELSGQIAKTHSGMQAQFAFLVKDEKDFNQSLRGFLDRAYALKSICDYEIDPDVKIISQQARETFEHARSFVHKVRDFVSSGLNGV